MKIPSLSAPDRYERSVAYYLNNIDNVTAIRPKVSTKYSDVLIEYNKETSWLEVKMNENDQMGCPRVCFDGKQWTGKSAPIQNFVCDRLNNDNSFINNISNYVNTEKFNIPTTKGGLKDSAAIPLSTMIDYFEKQNDAYIYTENDVNIGNLITQHYNHGKYEPAHYIQMGDQFFQMGDENPFDLNVPKLDATGVFKVRISLRSNFYEVIPEIKIRDEIYSPFSVAPGTLKPHPF